MKFLNAHIKIEFQKQVESQFIQYSKHFQNQSGYLLNPTVEFVRCWPYFIFSHPEEITNQNTSFDSGNFFYYKYGIYNKNK